MDKAPPLRRSAGMRGTPADEPVSPEPLQQPPIRLKPLEAPQSLSPHPRPAELMDPSPRFAEKDVDKQRQAFRQFMISRALAPTRWADLARIPVGEIFAFLNRNTHCIAPASLEKLARAAGVESSDLFRG